MIFLFADRKLETLGEIMRKENEMFRLGGQSVVIASPGVESHQVSEVLDGEADAFLCGRVQGLLQEPGDGAKLEYLDGTPRKTIKINDQRRRID